METSLFGTTPAGEEVKLFKLKNAGGLELHLSELGACVISVKTPDRNGQVAEITQGNRDFQDALENPAYLGATVGRYANRIADGKFSLDGKAYELAITNEHNGFASHLHGGVSGFSHKVWTGISVKRPEAEGVAFSYHSDDGEEGYPGNLIVEVTYWLTDANKILIEVQATTDAPTPVNIINHAYWNLSGDLDQKIYGHELTVSADAFLLGNEGLIPTGERVPVKGTPLDFTNPKLIGDRIQEDYKPLVDASGYDHCFVIRDFDGQNLLPAATAYHPESGRVMEVFTNYPGVQLYTGNFLDNKQSAFCLETQAFPNSLNEPSFPNTILRPGETYRRHSIFRFSTREA